MKSQPLAVIGILNLLGTRDPSKYANTMKIKKSVENRLLLRLNFAQPRMI